MVRLPTVPKSLKACEDGWTEISVNNNAFELVEEGTFFDSSLKLSLVKTLVAIANRIEDQLRSRGMVVNDVNIFCYLLHPAIDLLTDCTNQQLVKNGKRGIGSQEIWEFIGTLMFRSGFCTSPEHAWDRMERLSEDFILMKLTRFNEILSCLRGFDVGDRSPSNSNDEWFPRYGWSLYLLYVYMNDYMCFIMYAFPIVVMI